MVAPKLTAYPGREHAVDRCIHIAGVTLGLAGFCVLLIVAARHESARAAIALVIYGAALLAMLACSAAYNLARPSARKGLLRRLDHAVIFVMIAGTYTPVAVIALGVAGNGLLAFVWGVAVAGGLFKLMFPGRLERPAVALYLLLGWSFLTVLDTVVAVVPRPALLLLAAGGVLYSAGVAFLLLERLPYHNAIWHGFVLLAAICHYAAVLGWLAPLSPART